MIKTAIIGGIASLGFAVGIASVSPATVAQTPHQMDEMQSNEQTSSRRIEQPLSHKAAVTLGGLGLIGLELWWFLFSKPKSQQATTAGGIQQVTVTVDGGYEPSRIVVRAGQPVRLNFDRQDPSSCLEEVRFPDFHIARELPLHQTTAIEFTPGQPGRYEFTCGMNMFRGVVEVQPDDATEPAIVPDATNSAIAPATAFEATSNLEGFQEATVTVEKGYQPERVIVAAGQPVRLHFQRHNPNHCLDQLLMPDFNLAVDLAVDQTTDIEFTPEQPGEYEFTCGMKMYRGIVEVKAAHRASV